VVRKTVNFWQDALKAISPLFSDYTIPNILDNACGCVARMILVDDTEQLPLAQLLPVYLKSLPLRVDFSENNNVYQSLFHLLKTSNKNIPANMTSLFSVFARSLSATSVPDNIKQEIVSILKALFQQYPNEMKQVVNSLPLEEQKQFQF